MLQHLKEEAAKYGLKVHMGKTCLLTNLKTERRPKEIKVGENNIKALEDGQ